MQSDAIQNDKRRAKRDRRLQDDKTCLLCGVMDAQVLVRLTPERVLALTAKAKNGETITLCENEINALTGRTVIEQDHVFGISSPH
jgi:hypothetical protein